MRVAIVNDVLVIAEGLRRIVAAEPDLEVAWVALDGDEAVQKCAGDTPDLVLMDLEMPRVDGIEATRRIMSATPCAILVVTASVDDNAPRVFRAMGHGALDAVNTPMGGEGGEALLAKIRMIQRLIGKKTPVRTSTTPPLSGAMVSLSALPQHLVVIGSSTGGPKALADIFSHMEKPPKAAIVVVQHVDAEFAPGLAAWLTEQAGFPVRTAVAGTRPRVGEAVIAASNDHLVLGGDLSFRYINHPADNPYRPSVDVFFKNVASVWPKPGVAVLLTGMGSDGGEGMLALKMRKWHTIAQDKATSVIYGMPKAAADMKAAMQILPLGDIARAIETRCGGVVA